MQYESDDEYTDPEMLAIYTKIIQLQNQISGLAVRNKRIIFKEMREEPDVDTSYFLPQFGFTIGQFCTFQVLNDTKKK